MQSLNSEFNEAIPANFSDIDPDHIGAESGGDDVLALDVLLANGLTAPECDELDAEDEDHLPRQPLLDEEFESADLDGEIDEDVVSGDTFVERQKANTKPKKANDVDFSVEASVYQRLIDCGLLKKVTDIVLAKVSIPWHLRDDATQEIHTTWAALTARPQFQRNQLANYAYLSGQHAALKIRRTIGAVVAIPGALFRTGRDTAFMEAIGAAVNPKDVDDYKDSIELSEEVATSADSWITERFFYERIEGLKLSTKQRIVAYRSLVGRESIDEIARAMETQSIYVERMLNQVTAKLEAKNVAGGVITTTRKSRKKKSVAAEASETVH